MTATSNESATRLARLLDPLRANPRQAALLCDIDGTLAPIVDRPQDAAVPDAARELLERLSKHFLLVACVSGRRAADARRLVGVDGLTYAGNHGFELLEPGAEAAIPDPAVGRRGGSAAAFAAALDERELAAAGVHLEDKGPIQALHWRGSPDGEKARALALSIAAAAQQAGLVSRWGRKVLEIRPVAGIDKGSVTAAMVRACRARTAMFGGDDATDLDAFQALRWMARAGRLDAVACVGVDSDEAPAGLAERTDVVVDGTDAFLDVLRMLAEVDA